MESKDVGLFYLTKISFQKSVTAVSENREYEYGFTAPGVASLISYILPKLENSTFEYYA